MYRPTLLGALSMTWKVPSPRKLVQILQPKRSAARILAELERTGGQSVISSTRNRRSGRWTLR
jgi:hypothetical protein